MRSRVLLLTGLALIFASILVMGPRDTASAQLVAGYTGFPTLIEDDAKFLCIAGTEEQTFANVPIMMWIGVDAAETSFEIGIFDGDTGLDDTGDEDWVNGNWDASPGGSYTQMVYELYPDPMKTGQTTQVLQGACGRPVCRWRGNDAGMPNNGWYNITVNTTAAAQAPSGNYFYRLVVSPEALATNDYSCFKLRSSGQASLLPGVFTVMAGPVSPADFYLVFPDFPNVTPSNYDGIWQFYAWIGDPQTRLEFWDGDFDFGDYQDNDLDTNDPNTSGIPSWAGGGAVAEGAQGQGDPQDDNGNEYLRVAPNTFYDIIDPNWKSYRNANPSGNLEWERFVLSTQAGGSADVVVNELPAGYYWWYIQGMDGHNLNAIRTEWEVFPPKTPEDGPPDEPPLSREPEFVPEPGALLLLGSGLAALASYGGISVRGRKR
jgi:hypothetical protein